jgi:hypothetical protein
MNFNQDLASFFTSACPYAGHLSCVLQEVMQVSRQNETSIASESIFF